MWKVNSHLSTRKTGKKDCEEWIDWAPGDTVDDFPSWCPVSSWEHDGHIEKADEKPKKESPDLKETSFALKEELKMDEPKAEEAKKPEETDEKPSGVEG